MLAFSALLPLINPLGSSLLFLGVVGNAPLPVFRDLARKVALSTVLFLLVIELAGAALLAFFDISLPVVQFAGGFVLAAMGWQMLNNQDKDQDAEHSADEASNSGLLKDKIFYPLTFPLTAGPGCIVVAVTLSAHASRHSWVECFTPSTARSPGLPTARLCPCRFCRYFCLGSSGLPPAQRNRNAAAGF